MTDQRRIDSLSTTRHVVLVLRLVLAPEKPLTGDVMDPETGWSRRFVGVTGLATVIERWSARAGRRPADEGQPDRPA